MAPTIGIRNRATRIRITCRFLRCWIGVPQINGATPLSPTTPNFAPSWRLFLITLAVLILGEARSGFGQAQQQSTQKSNLVSYLRTQHFICNTGYTPDLCHQHTLKLATVLARYHDELPSGWTWVLVRSDDWPTILRSLNLDTRSPAFTVLAKRQTFFNEALFGDDARQSAGLLRDFKIPLNQILDVAVSHELGHAFCSETRERDADRFAGQLRQTGAARCSGSQTPSTRDTIHTLEAPR